MMTRIRRRHSAEFKFRVALEAAKGLKTTNERPKLRFGAQEYAIHPNQISTWKQQLLTQGSGIFSTGNKQDQRQQEEEEAALYEQIGRLKVELEWLKKKLPKSTEAKRKLIELGHAEISLRRQCELLDLNRSSWYYEPAGESEFNLHLMRLIDEQYLRTPFLRCTQDKPTAGRG